MPPKNAGKGALQQEPEVPCIDPALVQATILRKIKARCHETHEAHVVCTQIVEDIYNLAEIDMVEHYIQSTAIPVTVHEISSQLLDAMYLIFINRDCGEDTDTSDTYGLLHEPPMIPTDPHCRGVVPTRVPMKLTSHLATKTPGGKSQKGDALRSTARDMKGLSAELAPKAPSVASVNSEGKEVHQTRETGGKKTTKAETLNSGQVLTIPTQENSIDETDEDEQVRANLEANRRRQQDIKHGSEKLHKDMENLQVKDFTIDGSEVIPVTAMDATKIPQRKIDIRSTLPEGNPSALLIPEPQTRGAKPVTAKPAAAKKPDWGLFTTQEVPVPPMVSGVTPSPGVASKEGDTAKRSEFKTTRISRAEYRKNVQAQSLLTIQPDKEEEEDDLNKRSLSASRISHPEEQEPVPRLEVPAKQMSGEKTKELQKQRIAIMSSHKRTPNEEAHLVPYARERGPGSPAKRLTAAALANRKALPPPIYPAVTGHGLQHSPVPSARNSVATTRRSSFGMKTNEISKTKVVVRGDLMDDVSKEFLSKYTSNE